MRRAMGDLSFTLGILLSGLLDAEKTLSDLMPARARRRLVLKSGKEHAEGKSGGCVRAVVQPDPTRRAVH